MTKAKPKKKRTVTASDALFILQKIDTTSCLAVRETNTHDLEFFAIDPLRVFTLRGSKIQVLRKEAKHIATLCGATLYVLWRGKSKTEEWVETSSSQGLKDLIKGLMAKGI